MFRETGDATQSYSTNMTDEAWVLIARFCVQHALVDVGAQPIFASY